MIGTRLAVAVSLFTVSRAVSAPRMTGEMPGDSSGFVVSVSLLTLLGILITSGTIFIAWSRRADERLRAQLAGRKRTRTGVLAIGAVALGLSLTAGFHARQAEDARIAAHQKFERLTGQIVSATESAMNRCLYGMRGARGALAAVRSFDQSTFRSYVEARNLEDEFPGVLGFGLIQQVRREDLSCFIDDAQREDSSFVVRSSSTADDLFIVRYVEPLDANREAYGFDIGSEPVRRAAIERAIQTGEPTLTGSITLVQCADTSAAFLYLLPIFRAPSTPLTVEEPRESFEGFVYTPLVLEQVIRDVDEAALGYLDFEIFDGPSPTNDNRIFDLDNHLESQDHANRTTVDARSFAGRMFHTFTHLKVGGRDWTLATSTTPLFEATIDRLTPLLLTLSGVMLSVLSGLVILSLGQSRAHAIDLARAITRDLEAAKADAERALGEVVALRAGLERHAILSVADTHGRIIDVNEGFCAISGYQRDELLGKDHRVLNSGTHSAEFWREMWRTVRGGEPWRGEVCNRRKDGSLYWVDSLISPHRGPGGEIEKYISIRFDITARKEAEASARHGSELLRRTGDLARVGGWDIELATGHMHWSEVTYQIHEVPMTTEIHLDSALDFFEHAGRATMRSLISRAATHGEPWDVTLSLRTTSGSKLWVRVRGEPVFEDGRITRIHGAIQDVTQSEIAVQELALRAQELALLRDEAEAATTAKSEFLANMSHEIRTPLTAMLGYADLLRDEPELLVDATRRTHAVETIQQAGQHLMTIINDVLDLSKIEAGKMTVERVETCPIKIVHEVASLNRPRAALKGLDIRVRLDSPVPEKVLSDPTRLRQILMNLCGNAVKFTERGSVTIAVQAVDDEHARQLIIDVEDTGSGLSPDQARQLFAAFVQADTTTTRKHGGTGLGLAICGRLALLMDGCVTLHKTAPGVGSTFRLALPLAVVDGARVLTDANFTPEAKRPRGTAQNAPRLMGRILLAEDGPDNQRLIAYLLRKAGAEVTVAENGRVALDLIEQSTAEDRPFDLLLTDMQMPEMDGYTLARTLRERGSALAIVALTAHAMAEDRARCEDAGCDDYATKPIDKAKLIEVCAAWLGRPGGVAANA